MIKIYGEEIDGIEICDSINVKTVRSCTYDFDAISKWVEYYITLNEALTTYQTSIALVTLDHGFIKLLESGSPLQEQRKQSGLIIYKIKCIRIYIPLL